MGNFTSIEEESHSAGSTVQTTVPKVMPIDPQTELGEWID